MYTHIHRKSLHMAVPNSKILFRILEVALGRKFSNSFFFFLQNCIWNYGPGSWFVPSLSFPPTLLKLLQLFSRNLIINRYMLYFINRWKCWKLCYLLCLCSLIRDTYYAFQAYCFSWGGSCIIRYVHIRIQSPIQGTGRRLMVEYTNRQKDVLSRIKMWFLQYLRFKMCLT